LGVIDGVVCTSRGLGRIRCREYSGRLEGRIVKGGCCGAHFDAGRFVGSF